MCVRGRKDASSRARLRVRQRLNSGSLGSIAILERKPALLGGGRKELAKELAELVGEAIARIG